MKSVKYLLLSVVLIMIGSALFAEAERNVDALILPEWHQSNPWNARCPGQGQNRANAGSHALALAKTMKYWAYPTYGTGSVSYVDDNYGTITQNFTPEINWDGMSNTLVFQTTQRFIYLCGAAVYTDYELNFSTSTLTNIRNALINNFSYDESIIYQNRSENSNFYWKSLIRTELDAARPVIYMAVLADGNEVAFMVDGYDDAGLFHINWSNVNYTDGWFDLNALTVGTETIPVNNQYMLTGIMPSNGPANIDESFETDFSNWNWQFSGHQSWTISTEAAFYGSQSAKSGNINDNQISSMFIQINVTQPDTISFYKRVSCESEPDDLYDHLAFFIDNVEQERWSGDGSWAYHEYPVTPGLHEFRWTFSKDGASDYYSDCAWLDGIDFPEGSTPLMAPLFVEAEVSDGNNIHIGWAPPAGTNPSLQGYKVFRNGSEIVQFSNPAMTSYNEYNMPNGDYTYFVRSVFTEGISNPSNSSTVTVEVPYAPTNLTATLIGINTAGLAWTAPPLQRNRALMGYKLYRDDVVVAQIENPESLSYDDPNLPEGVFFYEVTAIYSSGESVRSNTAQIAVGVPEPPANFQAVVTGSTVDLSWSQVAETTYLTGFKVFRNGIAYATIDSPTQLSYADTNVPNGAYSYYMHAIYGNVESGNSATVHVNVEVPYPPVNVVAIAIGDDVQLSWSNPESTRALTQYYVYRGGEIIAATFGANSTIYLDQNLYNGIYIYNVSAVYSGIQSPLSAPVQVRVEVLYPPTNLSYTVALANVSLNWVIPVNHGGLRSFNGYNVYRDNQLISFVTSAATTHFTDNGVPNGVYTYEVSAVYSTGESARISVNNVLVEVLYPVAQLNYQIADDDVTLTWTAAPSSPAGREVARTFLHYNLYKNGLFLVQTTNLSYLDSDLANGNYSYYVKAVYASGESEASPTVSFEMELLYAPTALTAVVNMDDVSLAWLAPVTSGGLRALTGYRIYRDNIVIANTSALVWQDNNLANGLYEYKLVAVYAGGVSLPSNVVTAVVEVLYPPRSLNASVLDRNDVLLSWQAPVAIGGLRTFLNYQIYRNNAFLAQSSALTYSDENLADGSYSYYIKAVYETGSSLQSNTDSVVIEYPYPPTNVSTSVNAANVTITWTAVPGTGVQYQLYRDDVLVSQLAGTSYLDAGLNNGVYDYYVITINSSDSGPSDPSVHASATVAVDYPPSMLIGTVFGDDVSLSWTAPANGPRALLNYNVYRGAVLIGTSMNLNFSDPDLANGSYAYHVTAVYNSGESIASNVVNLLVEVFYPATGLSAVVTGDDVALSWTAAVNSGGLRAIQGYKIWRENTEIAQVTGTTYNDNNLANGVYHYYVKAVYSTGVSAASNTVTAVIELLYPPTNLSYQTEDDNVILSWTPAVVTGGLRSFLTYKIYRDGVYLASSTSATYTDANLANGSYQYYVRANYSTGESTPSNTVTVLMEVLYPAANLSYQVTGDDVSLFWTAAATSGGLRNFLGYRVMRDGAQIAIVPGLTYIDNNLANGIYNYYIVAAYSSGDALASNAINALVEVLYAPSLLTYLVNANTVNLQWTAAPNSSRALLGYNVYRNGNLLGLSPSTSYADAGLANGIYAYYVTALYGTGESIATNTVQATVEVLYAPSNLTFSVLDDDVSLAWNAAPSGPNRSFLGYKIYRDNALIGSSSSLTYTDLNLANGSYAYHVVADYSSGASLPTNTINVLVEVYYPATALTAMVSGDDVALSWTAAVNSGGLRAIQGYKIWRDNAEIAQVTGTTYSDINLANGVYHYYVKAVYSTGISAASNLTEAIVEVLYAPTTLTHTVSGDDVNLSWTTAPISGRNLIGYRIYKNGSSLNQTSQTTYTDPNLANGSYQYYVTALYSSGESTPTNTVTAVVEVTYPVTNLSASVSEDNVTLSWVLPVISQPRAFTGYFIYRNNTLHQVLNDPALTSWTDYGLANGAYSYYMIAIYGAGLSIPSNVVNVDIYVMPDLFPPTGLTANISNIRDVNLSWTAPQGTVQFYRIFRNAVEISTTTATNYTDPGLANGSYDYYVKAQYAEGLSSASGTATVNIMIADPPTALTAAVTGGNNVLLSWSAPNQGEIGYIVYRGGSELNFIPGPLTLSYTDSGLSNGIYSYQVAAVYASVISARSAAIPVTIEAIYSPTAFVLQTVGTQVNLSWMAPVDTGGFLAYKVWRDGNFLIQTSELTYTDMNLANGSYDYYLTAVYSNGESSPTPTLTAMIQITYPPSDLQAVVSNDSAILSWSPASDLDGFLHYNIYRNGILLTNSTTVGYTDTALANGSFGYHVTSLYSFGESLPTNTATVLIELLYPATALGSSVVDNDVFLSWTAPVNSGGLRSLTGYSIYRDSSLLASTTQTAYTDLNLNNGSYQYTVSAVYETGESSQTAPASAIVMIGYPPLNLQAVVNSNDINITWAAPADAFGVTAYKVLRGGVVIATQPQTMALQYSDMDMANGIYSYTVIAVYDDIQSDPSAAVDATVIIAYSASNLTGSIDQNDITLNWDAPADSYGLQTYLIFRNEAQIATSTTTSYTDLDLANGSYAYYVVARYSSGDASPSNSYSALVQLPFGPQNATITINNNNVQINWQAPIDPALLTEYRVYRDEIMIYAGPNLSANDLDLINGDYSYTVLAVYGTVLSPATTAGTAHIEIHYVPGTVQTSVYLNSVEVSWGPVSDPGFFVHYKVFRDAQEIGTTTAMTFNDYNLPNGSFEYSVSGVYENGESSQTASASASVMIGYPPTDLQLIVEGNTVQLSWQPPTDVLGFQGYEIYQDGLELNETTELNFTITNLSNGSHYFSVGARYINNSLGMTDPITTNILLAYPPLDPTTYVNANDVMIAWYAPLDQNGVIAYKVLRDGLELAIVSETLVFSYWDNDLANGIYSYSVISMYEEFQSDPSPTVEATVLITYPVRNLTAMVEIPTYAVVLSWDAPLDTGLLSNYRIYRNDIHLGDISSLEFSDATAPNGTQIYSVVAAYGDSLSEAVYTTIEIFVMSPVQNVLATPTGMGYDITWSAPNAITAPDLYEIYFLADGQQLSPELWSLVTSVDSVMTVSDNTNISAPGDYLWAVKAVYGSEGVSVFSNVITVVPMDPPPPNTTKLLGNFPNPFNPETRIKFQLKQTGPVKLLIYNDKGQLVRTLKNESMPSGVYQIPWDGKNDNGRTVNSGLYIYKLITTGFNKSGKMMLIK